MEVVAFDGTASCREAAWDLLVADEARHNLAFGILATAEAHPELYPDVRAWVARDGGRAVGAALRTPPHNVVVLRPTDERALALLAEAIDDEIPGVVGAVPEVDAFASAWSARHGLRTETRFEQGVYALRTVVAPRQTPGCMRLATSADREPVLAWVSAFAEELFAEGPERERDRLERSVDARLSNDEAGFALWEVNGGAVSLAGFGGPTPNGIRIGPVYTPPEFRGHGFASGLTARVSQLQLDRGRRFCFLYTDLTNPTSNAIYMRIGYERVCDSRELAFEPQPVPPAEHGSS